MKGFLGGTFDPIHLGHITLAVQALEEHGLEEVLFCPALCSPFKTNAPPAASAKERLEMLKLALDHPKFKIVTLELEKKGPSYTIETIRALNIPRLRLILSEESALDFPKWKDPQSLIRLAPPLTLPRTLPISSTDIRARLKQNLYCGHLVPATALAYIHKHKIYL